MLRILYSSVRAIWHRHRQEADLDDEIRFHLSEDIEELTEDGISPDDARLAAQKAFGNVTRIREATRESWGWGWAERLLQDCRYAMRTMRRESAFTTTAVVTLGLGVAATSAVFSVMNAVMLQPLPYPDADRLVRIWESNLASGRTAASSSQPNFLDWQARATVFSALAAASGTTFTVTSDQGAEMARGERVSLEFLSVQGVPPLLGRDFFPNEDRPGGNARVTILSDGFWKRHFSGDRGVLGRQISLSGTPYTVVGVLPASFRWDNDVVDLLVPLAFSPTASRGDRQLDVVGRLKPGVTIERASSELTAVAASLAEQYPDTDKGWSIRMLSYYDWLVPRGVRDSLTVLLAAIGVVLLIACVNVANLLLARAAARQKELAIRVGLGATRARIVRQLLTESVLLALLAGLIGVAAGAAVSQLLVHYGPTAVPRLGETVFDVNVVIFTLGISGMTAILFGLAPAIQLSRQPSAALQEGPRGSSAVDRQGVRSILTVLEVALSVVLLIGAGLLLRSVWRLQHVDPGFDPSPLTMARVTLPGAAYPNGQGRATFFERLLNEIPTLPGIVGAAASSGLPLAGGNFSTDVHVPNADENTDREMSASWRLITPGYFAAMGIALRGRDFTWHDRESATPTVIISESMVRQFWPDDDPIGRTVTLTTFGNRTRTIVGIARDVRHIALDTEARSTVYFSAAEVGVLAPMTIVWRTTGRQDSHIKAVRDLVRRTDRAVALFDIQPLDDLVATSFAPRRFNLLLLGGFAGVALMLAAIGLFGLTAYLVSQRSREIGVRLALGANRRDIFRLILGRGLALALSGALIGLGAAFWTARVMENLLFAVSTTDPATFAAVPAILVAVALFACSLPARRATKIDPIVSLRCE